MADFELPQDAAHDLDQRGFTVLPGPIPYQDLVSLSEAYDRVVEVADAVDIRVGSSTTRVSNLVNRGPEFDPLYLHPPLLKACCRLIDGPVRLSTMLARTLHRHQPAQELHVDFGPDAQGWTMVGFIFMLDEFRSDNGATRFVPGSHLPSAELPDTEEATGPAGSMIVYNGSVLHGHGANRTGSPRRSIQGAYIRRDAESAENLPARMLPETLARLSPLAKYLIGIS